MAGAGGGLESPEICRLLAGAAKVVASVRYCWLVLPSDDRMPTARPMGHLLDGFGDTDWSIRFLTDARSRKVSALRHSGVLAVVLQNDAEDAFVLLAGKAALLREPAEVRKHWRSAFTVYFPTEEDREHAAFVEMGTTHMELWIRGVTPEPFGMRATILERHVDGIWRFGTC